MTTAMNIYLFTIKPMPQQPGEPVQFLVKAPSKGVALKKVRALTMECREASGGEVHDLMETKARVYRVEPEAETERQPGDDEADDGRGE